MNARSLKFKPRVVQIILITATILFVVAYIVVSRQMHVEQRSAFRSIRRVYRLRDQLTRLGLTLDAAETGQRRFLLTGHYQELSPYLSNRLKFGACCPAWNSSRPMIPSNPGDSCNLEV